MQVLSHTCYALSLQPFLDALTGIRINNFILRQITEIKILQVLFIYHAPFSFLQGLSPGAWSADGFDSCCSRSLGA